MLRRLICTRFVAATALAALFVAPSFGQDEKPAKGSVPIPADAPVVVTLRPATLLKRADVKALYEELTKPDEIQRVVNVAEPESIEDVTFVLLSRDLKVGGDPGEAIAQNGAVIVRTNKPREWKALAAAAGVPLVKATHAGKDYYRISGEVPFGFYQADATTVVGATEANLRRLIDGPKADGKKASPIASAAGGPGATIAAATVDFAWVRGLLEPAIKANKETGIAMALIGPIWEKTDGVAVRLSTNDDGFTLTADHFCADEDGATRVEKTLDAFLTLGRNVAPEGLRQLRQQAGGAPAASEVADLAEGALKTASIAREGARVRVKVAVKADLEKLMKLWAGR